MSCDLYYISDEDKQEEVIHEFNSHAHPDVSGETPSLNLTFHKPALTLLFIHKKVIKHTAFIYSTQLLY